MKKIFTLLLMLCALGSFAQIRISQVYGNGGNTGASYNRDYAEIFNAGTTAVDISGYTVQYGSATGTGNWAILGTVPAATSIPAGGYYLFGGASGSTGAAIVSDATTTSVNMSATNGKVALVNNATLLVGAAGCATASVVDVIGFGTANCAETAAFATSGITATQAIFRKTNGCTETENNSADFEILTAIPRNSSSAVAPCSGAAVASITGSPNITGLTTISGVASAEGSFNLAGTNLTGFPANISATASTDIEVSLAAGGPYTNSVNVPYTSATLASTPIYVRIAATAPAGAVSGTVTLAGGGDTDGASVTVSGSVTVAEPTVQATNVTFSNIANNSFDVNWTNGNGSSRLVVVKQTGASPVAVAPTDGIDYTVGAFTGSGNRVVYAGTGSGPITVTGLLGGTSYDIYVYEYNGTAGSNNYLSTAATGNPGVTTTTGISPNLTQMNFTSVATPQYGASGTSTRLPVMFYATVSGLSPNTTYRYINQAAATTDFTTTALGAGNPILIDHTASPMTFIYSSSPSISSAGSYGLFETDGTGSFTGAFGLVNTGNARFAAGEVFYPSIAIAEDVSSPVIQNRFALNVGITALGFGTAVTDSGTFIKGGSAALPGNIVGLWSTIDGNIVAQRPLAMTIAENPTFTGATWAASFVTGYDQTAGAWNAIIPNNNANGVRLIQQFDLATGNVIGCNSDADGIWPGGANTTVPSGATAQQITITDAPLNAGSCFSILPVSISSFSVQKSGTTTKIFWTTEQEINSREFVIERSNDQRTWTVVATVAAAGTSTARINYSTTDYTPAKGINFYRLRMVDRDNRAENSATRSVLFGNADVVLITPNPATSFATIYMGKNNNSLSQIFVTDMNGKLVERVNTADQTHTIQTARYSKGLYIIKVVTEGNTSTHKLVVQ